MRECGVARQGGWQEEVEGRRLGRGCYRKEAGERLLKKGGWREVVEGRRLFERLLKEGGRREVVEGRRKARGC